jgi:predicted DNA-binding transcriptional regulator YafY
VVSRRGNWYVAGHDRAADPPGTRVFRMNRIDGPVKMAGQPGTVEVPPGIDVRELVTKWGHAGARPATLRVRGGAGLGLRRHPATASADPDTPGWDIVTARFTDVRWYADYVAWFGPDVVVLGPPDLRDAVIACLKGSLA